LDTKFEDKIEVYRQDEKNSSNQLNYPQYMALMIMKQITAILKTRNVYSKIHARFVVI
jgi:hypothetical protein